MSTKKNGSNRTAAKQSKNPVTKTTVREVLDSVMKSPAASPTRADVTSLYTKWLQTDPLETEIMDFFNEVRAGTVSMIKMWSENLSKQRHQTGARLEEMDKFTSGNLGLK